MAPKQTFPKTSSKGPATKITAPAGAVNAIQMKNRKFRDLLDSLPLTVFEIDRHAKVVFANRHAMKDSGYTMDELRGMPAINFFIPEDRDRVTENIGKILSAERVSGNEYTVLRKDGSVFPAVIYSNTTCRGGRIVGITGIFIDISESKHAQQKVEAQLQFQKTLLDTIPNPVFYKDMDGRYTGCNEAFMGFLGRTPEEIIGKTVYDMAPEDMAQKYFEMDRDLFITGNKQCYEWTIKKKNGEIRDVIFNKAILKDIDGKPEGLIGVLSDITERKQAEKELKKAEELYRNLVENIAIGVALISPEMQILTLNRQMKKWFPKADPAKRPLCYEVFNNPPGKGLCSYCPTYKTLRDGEVYEATTETPAGDEIRNYRIVSSPIRNTKGDIVCAIEMVDDITEKKHIHEQIHSLTQSLLTTQESERLKLSRELHDSLAQDLAAAKMHCDITLDNCLAGQPVPIQLLKNTSEILNKCISNVRRLAFDLRPSELIQFGIVETLRKHCKEFSETHRIPVDFQTIGFETIVISDLLSINIFRLVQEGLNNIMKHASASQVVIRLFASLPHIILRIEDNGKGFDLRKRQASITEEKRLGLRSMQERVELMGGEMIIDSKPGFGTKLLIKVPCRDHVDDI